MREFVDASGVSHQLRLTMPIIDQLAGAEKDPVDLLEILNEETTVGNRLMTDPRFLLRVASAMCGGAVVEIDAATTAKLYEAVTAEIVGFFPSAAARQMVTSVLFYEMPTHSVVTTTSLPEASQPIQTDSH